MRLLTSDIYEGAYLLSQGMQLEKLWLNGKNGPDGSRASYGTGKRSVVFEFAGPQAELLRKDYEKGKASANVTKLKQSITQLKDCMFNLLRTEKSRSEAEIPIVASGRRENHEYQPAGTK